MIVPWVDVAKYAYDAGWRGENLAVAVAVTQPESGRRSDAVNDRNANGSIDRGLWQVNSVHQFDPDRLFDPVFNAECAYKIWSRQGWQAWAAFNNHLHKPYLPVARVAMDGRDRWQRAEARAAQYKAERDRILVAHDSLKVETELLKAKIAAAQQALA